MDLKVNTVNIKHKCMIGSNPQFEEIVLYARDIADEEIELNKSYDTSSKWKDSIFNWCIKGISWESFLISIYKQEGLLITLMLDTLARSTNGWFDIIEDSLGGINPNQEILNT